MLLCLLKIFESSGLEILYQLSCPSRSFQIGRILLETILVEVGRILFDLKGFSSHYT
jgi:hypothetical protein